MSSLPCSRLKKRTRRNKKCDGLHNVYVLNYNGYQNYVMVKFYLHNIELELSPQS